MQIFFPLWPCFFSRPWKKPRKPFNSSLVKLRILKTRLKNLNKWWAALSFWPLKGRGHWLFLSVTFLSLVLDWLIISYWACSVHRAAELTPLQSHRGESGFLSPENFIAGAWYLTRILFHSSGKGNHPGYQAAGSCQASPDHLHHHPQPPPHAGRGSGFSGVSVGILGGTLTPLLSWEVCAASSMGLSQPDKFFGGNFASNSGFLLADPQPVSLCLIVCSIDCLNCSVDP